MFCSNVEYETTSKYEIVFHVRAGDIIGGVHKDYWPLPISYIRRIVNETALDPVFVGELGNDYYSNALVEMFPQARFICNSSTSDFETIRNAKNIGLSISTFSWLSAWLSKTATTIHVPVFGLLNPNQRPDINLLPLTDRRFLFHQFSAVAHFEGRADQISWLLEPNSVYADGVTYSTDLRPPPLVRTSRRIVRKARHQARTVS